MATKKPTTPTAPNEVTLLRARCKALETELASTAKERDSLSARHGSLVAELRRRGSGLPILARLVDVVIEMHGKDTAGRTILIGVAKTIAEMRAFNGSDELPGRDEIAADLLYQYGRGKPIPSGEPGSHAVSENGQSYRNANGSPAGDHYGAKGPA